MKKTYITPYIRTVLIHTHQPVLAGSISSIPVESDSEPTAKRGSRLVTDENETEDYTW